MLLLLTSDSCLLTAVIAGLVLAAGESSRMGTDKALLEYRGRTFLETIVQALRDAGVERIVVVLGHHADEIQRAVRLGEVESVINPDYRQGQTSSLQAGLEVLTNSKAVLLCLVDHPAVSAGTIRRLILAFRESPAPVIVPTHHGKRGHPVLIARALFRELSDLTLGEGANAVIRKYQQDAKFVEVDDPAVLWDIDDPETYERLLS